MVDPDRVITLTLGPDFAKLVDSVHTQHKIDHLAINQTILALDPGETTGVAEYDGDHTIRVYQKVTQDLGQSFDWLCATLAGRPGDKYFFEHLRVEDYRVYEWKVADHAWSPVHTIQWIGGIRVAAHKTGVPISFCMAQHAKGFWTDSKLDHFGLNPKGLRHGRDALRHLLYYILFPTKAGV